jgi:hypothetical protein
MQTLANDNRLAAMPQALQADHRRRGAPRNAPTYKKILRYFKGTPCSASARRSSAATAAASKASRRARLRARPAVDDRAQGYLADIRSLQIQLKDFNFARVAMNRAAATSPTARSAPRCTTPAPRLRVEGVPGARRRPARDRVHPDRRARRRVRRDVHRGRRPRRSVSGETPRTERQRIYRELREARSGRANAMVLTEGFDEPSVDCIIVARPTLSRSLFMQMIGRGLRLHPGKADCLVLDMVGNTDRVRLVTIPNLFGVPDESMREGSDRHAGVAAQHQDEGRAAKLDARPDIEAIAVDLFTQRKFHWVQTTTRDGEQNGSCSPRATAW